MQQLYEVLKAIIMAVCWLALAMAIWEAYSFLEGKRK